MLLFPNARCCSMCERNFVCVVTKIFKKFLPANNFCQLLRVTRKRNCTSDGNAQAQLHFRDDQQRAFGISNISNWRPIPGGKSLQLRQLIIKTCGVSENPIIPRTGPKQGLGNVFNNIPRSGNDILCRVGAFFTWYQKFMLKDVGHELGL